MPIVDVDPFDLPEWVGTRRVSWVVAGSIDETPHVRGQLTSGELTLGLDLLAVDAAYPEPVSSEEVRRAAHRAWRFGEVALLDMDGRLTAGVPASRFDVDLACEALRRVAKAVAAPPGNFIVSIAL